MTPQTLFGDEIPSEVPAGRTSMARIPPVGGGHVAAPRAATTCGVTHGHALVPMLRLQAQPRVA